jgi:hypothetical protein
MSDTAAPAAALACDPPPAEPIAFPNPITAWALAATPRSDGEVDIAFSLTGEHGEVTACITVPRAEARNFARSVMAAAGDATERTQQPEGSR